MEKKLQVFISSTYTDLIKERQAVVEAILKLGHIPAGMELFSANDKKQFDVIKKWINDCDIFILVLGGKYGTIEETTGKSYIHLEYEYAKKNKKKPIVFIMNDKMINTKIKNYTDEINNKEFEKKDYLDFKQKILKNKMCSFFDSSIKLESIVKDAIRTCEKENIYDGWIKGEQRLVQFAADMEKQINSKKIGRNIYPCVINSNLPIDCTKAIINDYLNFACSSIYLEHDYKKEHFIIDNESFTYIKKVTRKEVFNNPNQEKFIYNFKINYSGRKNYESDKDFFNAKLSNLELLIDNIKLEKYVELHKNDFPNSAKEFLKSRDIFDLFTVKKDYNGVKEKNKISILEFKIPILIKNKQITIEYTYQSKGNMDYRSLNFTFRSKYICKSFNHVFSIEPTNNWGIELSPFLPYYLFAKDGDNPSKDNPTIPTSSEKGMLINEWMLPGIGYKRTIKYKGKFLLRIDEDNVEA